MKIWGMFCMLCRDFVFSRAHHDLRKCTCGAVGVDGGQDENICCRVLGHPENRESGYVVVGSSITLKTLFDDWNSGDDKYGIMKQEEYEAHKIEK